MSIILNYLYDEFSRFGRAYLSFAAVGVVFLLTLYLFAGERMAQFVTTVAFVSFYIVWGIYHHIFDDSLYLKTVVEYIFIGFTLLLLIKVIILP